MSNEKRLITKSTVEIQKKEKVEIQTIELNQYLTEQFYEEVPKTFAHSLAILESYCDRDLTITQDQLLSQDPESRFELIQKLQDNHYLLNYQSAETVEAFINIITKVLFFHIKASCNNELTLEEAEELLDELNLDITYPITYISKIFTLSKVTSQTKSQANKHVRNQLSEILMDENEDTDIMNNFSNMILEIADEDFELANSILRELLFESTNNINILRSVFYAQNERYGTYQPNGYRENMRRSNQTAPNNIEAACFAQEVTTQYVDLLIQQYVAHLNDEYLPYSSDEFDYHYERENQYDRPDEIEVENNIEENPIIETILGSRLLYRLLFDADGDLIYSNYNKRIEIVTTLLQVLMEKRDYWITITDKKTGKKNRVLKDPYIESYYKFINVQSKKYSNLFKDLGNLQNNHDLSKVELKEPAEVLQIGLEVSQNAESIQPIDLIDPVAEGITPEIQEVAEIAPETQEAAEIAPETQEAENKIVNQIVNSLTPVLKKAGSNQNKLLEEFISKITDKFDPATAQLCKAKILENLKSNKSSFKLR